ncbi:MAG: hypothetical protein ACI4MJ_05945 [Aristaeellaceae bacterium]
MTALVIVSEESLCYTLSFNFDAPLSDAAYPLLEQYIVQRYPELRYGTLLKGRCPLWDAGGRPLRRSGRQPNATGCSEPQPSGQPLLRECLLLCYNKASFSQEGRSMASRRFCLFRLNINSFVSARAYARYRTAEQGQQKACLSFSLADTRHFEMISKRNTQLYEQLLAIRQQQDASLRYTLCTDVIQACLFDAIIVALRDTIADDVPVEEQTEDSTSAEREQTDDFAPAPATAASARLLDDLFRFGFTIRDVPLDSHGFYEPHSRHSRTLHYIPFIASAGGARESQYLFVRDDMAGALMERLSLDVFSFNHAQMPVVRTDMMRQDAGVFVPSKAAAYIGQSLSDGISMREALQRCSPAHRAELAPLLQWNAVNTMVAPDVTGYHLNVESVAPWLLCMKEQTCLPDSLRTDGQAHAELLLWLTQAPQPGELSARLAKQLMQLAGDTLRAGHEASYEGQLPDPALLSQGDGAGHLPFYAVIYLCSAYVRHRGLYHQAVTIAPDDKDFQSFCAQFAEDADASTAARNTLRNLLRERPSVFFNLQENAAVSLRLSDRVDALTYGPALMEPKVLWADALVSKLCSQRAGDFDRYWTPRRAWLAPALHAYRQGGGPAMHAMIGLMMQHVPGLSAATESSTIEAAIHHPDVWPVFQAYHAAYEQDRKQLFENTANASDGMGFAMPEVFHAIERAMHGGTLPETDDHLNAIVIRLPWMKGVLIKLDFHRILQEKYMELLADNGQRVTMSPDAPIRLKDIYGQTHALEELQVIFTRSMFKGASVFSTDALTGLAMQGCCTPWELYWNKIQAYGFTLLVAGQNTAPAQHVRMNYQFLSTMDIHEDTLTQLIRQLLCDYAADPVRTVCAGPDPSLPQQEADNADGQETVFRAEQLLHQLMHQRPELRQTSYVRNTALKQLKRLLFDELLQARLPAAGDNRFIVGDVDMLLTAILHRSYGIQSPPASPINQLSGDGYGLGQYYAPGKHTPWSLDWARELIVRQLEVAAAGQTDAAQQMHLEELLHWHGKQRQDIPDRAENALERCLSAILKHHEPDPARPMSQAELWALIHQRQDVLEAVRALREDECSFQQPIVFQRNPHLSRGEAVVLAPLSSGMRHRYDRHYSHLTGVVFVPNLAMMVAGGADMDGDLANLCSSLPLVEAVARGNDAASSLLGSIVAHRDSLRTACSEQAVNRLIQDYAGREGQPGLCAQEQIRLTASRRAGIHALFRMLAASLDALPAALPEPYFRRYAAVPLLFAGTDGGRYPKYTAQELNHVHEADGTTALHQQLRQCFRLTAMQRIGIDSLACLEQCSQCFAAPTANVLPSPWVFAPSDSHTLSGPEIRRYLHDYLTHMRLWSLAMTTGLEIDMAKTGIRPLSVALMRACSGDVTLGIIHPDRNASTPYRICHDSLKKLDVAGKAGGKAWQKNWHTPTLAFVSKVLEQLLQEIHQRSTVREGYAFTLDSLPGLVQAQFSAQREALQAALGDKAVPLLHCFVRPSTPLTIPYREAYRLDTEQDRPSSSSALTVPQRMAVLMMAYQLRMERQRDMQKLCGTLTATYTIIQRHLLQRYPLSTAFQALNALLPPDGESYLRTQLTAGTRSRVYSLLSALAEDSGQTTDTSAPTTPRQRSINAMNRWLSAFYLAQTRQERAQVLIRLITTCQGTDSEELCRRLRPWAEQPDGTAASSLADALPLRLLTDIGGITLFKQLLKYDKLLSSADVPRQVTAGDWQAAIPMTLDGLRDHLLQLAASASSTVLSPAEMLYDVSYLLCERHLVSDFTFVYLNQNLLLTKLRKEGAAHVSVQ